MTAAIRVEHVFKKFRRGERHGSLRDLAAAWLRRPAASPLAQLGASEFWALNDVSFEVRPGEALGIIGPNGAGKSTMLKLLAGILRPTQGRVALRGRTSALIEVGAGFHPDLTGRENIFLNASILGMKRGEVRRKFDEIVTFAGVEDFLDTPIKRYSSGMHARLGFSVAAHVEPDILLVDEVLSVGDRVFRAKCMEKMRSFLARGVAVVFVSHDLGAVGRFCDRAMVLSRGRVSFAGETAQAVRHYYEATGQSLRAAGERGMPLVRVSGARLTDADGRPLTMVSPGKHVSFTFDVDFEADMAAPSYGLSVIEMAEQTVVFETSSSRLEECHADGSSMTAQRGAASVRGGPAARRGERHRVRYDFVMNLQPGEYAIGHHVRDTDALTYAADDALAVRVLVEGQRRSTGHAHLAPRASVELCAPSEKAGMLAAALSDGHAAAAAPIRSA